MPTGIHVAIVSPFPNSAVYMDGWMSRIKTIDLLLSDQRRVYIDFQIWFPEESPPELVHKGELVTAFRVNPWSKKHKSFVADIFAEARFIYVHTLHQCEFMLQHFDPEKVFIDIHGIVPEEEEMMGSKERSLIFEEIEREAL